TLLSPTNSTLFPYTTLFRSRRHRLEQVGERLSMGDVPWPVLRAVRAAVRPRVLARLDRLPGDPGFVHAGPRHRLLRELAPRDLRSEEHTSELQSRFDLVCRL